MATSFHIMFKCFSQAIGKTSAVLPCNDTAIHLFCRIYGYFFQRLFPTQLTERTN